MESQHQGSQTIIRNSSISRARVPGHYLLVSFRWIVTTDWILFVLAALLVSISFLVSFYTGAWHWFQRSGAMVVSIGAILSTRQPLGLILDSMIGDIGSQSRTQMNGSLYLGNLGELRTCACGFIFVAMGTLIWAYGDLIGCLIHWDTSCLI